MFFKTIMLFKMIYYTIQVYAKGIVIGRNIPQYIVRVIKNIIQVPDEHVDTRQFTHYICDPSVILIILYSMAGSALYFL